MKPSSRQKMLLGFDATAPVDDANDKLSPPEASAPTPADEPVNEAQTAEVTVPADVSAPADVSRPPADVGPAAVESPPPSIEMPAESADSVAPRDNSEIASSPTSGSLMSGPPTSGRTYVIDAHSLIYQVFHALPEMSSPDGRPVAAVHGFTRDMLDILESHRPDYLICAFDSPGDTFRHEIYTKYKERRTEMPDDLRPQIPLIHRMLETLGIPSLGLPGFEADDILATVARQVGSGGGECVLVTGDKDCRQLITDRVVLLNLRSGERFDAAVLMKTWGVRPDQVVDFQTLVGDPTDDIPGVPLIGPKLAQELLAKYGTLEEVFAHAHEVSGTKRRENLINGREQAMVSRQLVRLKDDVPIELNWDAARPSRIDAAAAAALCAELGFRRLADRIARLAAHQASHSVGPARGSQLRDSSSNRSAAADDAAPFALSSSRTAQPAARSSAASVDSDPTTSATVVDGSDGATTADDATPSARRAPEPFDPAQPWPGENWNANYQTIATETQLAELVARLANVTRLSIDTETTSTRPRSAELVGVSLAWAEGEACYIPIRAPEGEPRIEAARALDLLRPLLENPLIEKVGQNLKYDLIVFRAAGVNVQGVAFDTMVADYLLEPGERIHNLDDLAERYLDHRTIKIEQLIGTGKKQKLMDSVPVSAITLYAAEDADVPLRISEALGRRLTRDGLDDLFRQLEMPLVEVLAELEYNGITVDVSVLKGLSTKYSARLDELRAEIYRAAGREFNIDSRLQLADILFNQLGLPSVKKTKTGQSTDAEVLEQLATKHELPAKLLEYRQLAKLVGTYIDALPELVHPATGRVHSSFKQDVAATGRLSSSDPNLQNIPVRTEAGREIRAAFRAGPPGWELVSADYSQIELRVLAHFSQDVALQTAFANDEDVHTRVASQVYGVSLADVTRDMRRSAKAINFGVIYGQSPFGLAKSLGIETDEAARFIDAYFAGYPGVAEFMEKVLDEACERGYVTTVLGRRRPVQGVRPRAKRGESRQRNLPERIAINTVIQGSAADVIKLAMVSLHGRLRQQNRAARMLLQIHDELVFEVAASERDDLIRLVVDEMTAAGRLSVPLKVDVKHGSTWADCDDA